jgi:alkylation response protein AidB-like acyl-CoA dehydrogenase/acyl carrier protein
VPAAYGGLEFGHRDMLRVLEQLGAIDPTLALFVGLNNVLGIQPILRSAPAALQEELLPRLATGRELVAFALTEPGAGSHPSSMSASAWAAADGGWRLRGEKIWSGSAAWAGVINVFVQQRDATGKFLGVSGFVVRKGTVGLRQGPEALTMGMRGMVQNTVYLEDVPVYAPQMLGEPGAGMAVAQEAMMYGRLAIAAASVGGMKRCAQLMLRYSSRRAIATGRLLENPLWLTRINGLTASITALETLVDDIARRLDQGANVPQEVYAICKIIAPEFYWRAADTLVQCLGGRGYIETNSAPQILRDARVLRIFEGPTEAMAMFVGARVLYQPAALQAFLTEKVHAPEIAQTLYTAADRILARYTAADSPFAAEPVARRQACLVIGEIAAWGVLLAVLQHAAHTDPAVQRSIEWTRGYFEHHIAQAQRSTPEESVVLSATETAEWIASYEATIGNIEQTLAGEDREIDALLRKDNGRAAGGSQSAVGTFPTSSQPLAPDARRQGTKAQRQSAASLQQWLSHWLAQRLQLSEATIDPGKAFADYGVDSVMAVELAQELEALLHLRQPLDATVAWNFPTIEALAGYLDPMMPQPEMPSTLKGRQNRAGDHAAASATPLANTTRLDDLSDAELAAALAAEIAAAKGRRV